MQQERRPVTVLFADIHDFTTLVDEIDPEQVVEALDLCLAKMASVVEAYGGHVDKMLGDGLMAIFGAPRAVTDHAAQAVRAGLALHSAMADLRDDLFRRVGRGLLLQVGISSGTVIAGPLGPPEQRTYTVVGEAANMSARLQEEARPGTVLVSEAAYRLVKRAFRWGTARTLRLRGKARLVRAHQPLAVRANADVAAAAAVAAPALRGRASELNALEQAWGRARRGRLQLVTVTGETGAGKSRLATEFAGRLQRCEVVQVLWVSPEGGLGQARKDAPSVAGGAAADEPAASPPATVWSIEAAIELLGRREAQRAALVIVDQPGGAGNAIDRLLRTCRGSPTMIVALDAARPARRLFRARIGRTSLHLKALGDSDATELLEDVVGGPVSPAVREQVLARARGLPLYVVEIGRWLLETGAIERQEGRFCFRGGGPPDQVPDSLRGALLVRIDRLEDPAKHALHHAAVLGESFSVDLLEAVMGAAGRLARTLRKLEQAGLVHSLRERGRRGWYAFSHPLLRETTYGSLLRRTAEEIHRRAAEALKVLPTDDRTGSLEAIAQHSMAGGDRRQAARYYLLAAAEAERKRIDHEAERLRRTAARLVGLTSVWFLYGTETRPAFPKRLLSVGAQLSVAALLAAPIFAFLISQPPPPERVTLGLPAEVSRLTPSTMALPLILGGFPFLTAGLLLGHLGAPNYLRGKLGFHTHARLVITGWAVALLTVAATLVILGTGLRFDFLPAVLAHFTGAAIFRLLSSDPRIIGPILIATFALSATSHVWLWWQAARRRAQILDAPPERPEGATFGPGIAARQLGLIAALSAALTGILLVLSKLDSVPIFSGYGGPPGPSIVIAGSAAGALFVAGLALRWAIRRPDGAGAATLGLEIPLLVAILLGAVGAAGLRQEVVALSSGLFVPGDRGALNRMAVLFPNLASVHYMRGEIQWFEGDEPGALADFERAIALDPSFPAAHAGRATLLTREGAYEEAIAGATRVIELRPDHPAGYGIRAAARAGAGLYEEASADLARAIEPLTETARGWDAYFVRCVALEEAGRAQDAIEDCRHSLELNDRHGGTYEVLGLLYHKAGRYGEALEMFGRMLRLVGEDAPGLVARAATYRALDRHEQALEDLDSALALDPSSDAAYRERALTYLALDRPGAAKADANRAVRINGDLAMNHYVRGYVATYTGDYDAVVASMDRALSGRPDPTFLNMRGYAYALLGDHERALDDLDLALLLDPSNAHVYDSKAVALIQAGRGEEALAAANGALEMLSPSDRASRAEFLFHQALAFEALDDPAAALQALAEANSFPTLPAVRHQIEAATLRLAGSS